MRKVVYNKDKIKEEKREVRIMKFGYIILNEFNNNPVNYIIFESKDDAANYIENNGLNFCYVEQFGFYKK